MSCTHNGTAVRKFLDWLDERCIFLRHLEQEAAHVAREESASLRYRQLMLQKALFLEAMGEEAEPFLHGLPPAFAERARVSPGSRTARGGPWNWIPSFICPRSCTRKTANPASPTTWKRCSRNLKHCPESEEEA